MPCTYADRLKIPLNGMKNIDFSTLNGLLLAKGYERVVIGNRGPYIEFNEEQIIKENITIPEGKSWRSTHRTAFYVEYRSRDYCGVKIYHQKRTVDYADYKINKWYISPFDLTSNLVPSLIEPLKRSRYKNLVQNNSEILPV